MAQQTINIGNYSDDGTGDTLRVGARKINENFTELYARTDEVVNGVIAGNGIGVTYSPSTKKVTITNTKVSDASFGIVSVQDQDAIVASGASSGLTFRAGENIRLTTFTGPGAIKIDAEWPTVFYGDTYGTHRGEMFGNLTGDVTANKIIGDLYAGNTVSKIVDNGTNGTDARFYGTHVGPVNGNVIGDVVGDLTGDVVGDLTGNVVGEVTLTRDPIDPDHAVPLSYLESSIASIPQYVLPAATSLELGGIKVGAGLAITGDGVLSYTLPVASNSTLGGIKIGSGLVINAGVVSLIQNLSTTGTPTFSTISVGTATVTAAPTLNTHATNKAYVDSQISQIPIFTLNEASETVRGGVRIGRGLEIIDTDKVRTVQDISTAANPTFNSLTINSRVTLTAAPTLGTDAVNKNYVDVGIASIPVYTPTVATSVVLGVVKVGSGILVNSGVISLPQEIATSSSPTFANISVSGTVTVPSAPTSNSQVANKAYVDSAISAQGNIPIGGIIMWSGAISAIPLKWSLCDGTNGTPDLRNRFIIGAGSTYAVASSGGSSSLSFTVSSAGGHQHGGQTGSTVLTVDQMPAHTHRVIDTSAPSPNQDTVGSFDTDSYTNQNLGAYVETTSVGGNQGHTHTINNDGTHTHTASNVNSLPPYYALAFIMRTA